MANFDVNVDFNIENAQQEAQRFANSLSEIEQQAEVASGGLGSLREIGIGALRAIGEIALQSAVAGLQALANQAVESVAKFAEFESSQQRLQQSLERTGRSAQDFVLAQNTIRESSELLGQSQAELSQIYNRAVTLIGDSSFDVDRAFQLARNSAFTFGEDFENTMDIVSEAVKDPESAMEAFTTIGVQFTNQQKEALKALVDSGKEAEATAYAFEILEAQSSVNIDSSEGLTFAFNKLNARIESLQIALGRALAPAVEAIVRKFSEFLDQLQNNEQMSRKFESAVQGLANYINNIDIKKTIEAFNTFWNVMAGLAFELKKVYDILSLIGKYTPQGQIFGWITQNFANRGSQQFNQQQSTPDVSKLPGFNDLDIYKSSDGSIRRKKQTATTQNQTKQKNDFNNLPTITSGNRLPPVNDVSKKVQSFNAPQVKVTQQGLLDLGRRFGIFPALDDKRFNQSKTWDKDDPRNEEMRQNIAEFVKYLLGRPEVWSQIETLAYSPVLGRNMIKNGKLLPVNDELYKKFMNRAYIGETSKGQSIGLMPDEQFFLNRAIKDNSEQQKVEDDRQRDLMEAEEKLKQQIADVADTVTSGFGEMLENLRYSFGEYGRTPFFNGLNFGNGFLSVSDQVGVLANGFDVVNSDYAFPQQEKGVFGESLSSVNLLDKYIDSITPKLESAESAFMKVADSVLQMTGVLDASSLSIKLNEEQIQQQIRVINQYEQVVNTAENALTNFAISAISNFDSIGSAFGQLAQQILSVIANQAFSNIFGGLLGGLIPSFNTGLIGGLGTVGSSVFSGSNFGLFPSTFGTGGISFFADGGVVSRPTNAIIGERGSEAIVPLPDGRSIPVKMQGGGNVNITVNVQGGGNEQNGQRLGRQISQAIKAELINQKRTGGLLS